MIFGTEKESARQMQNLLEKLGFHAVQPVHKIRHAYHLLFENTEFEIVLDEVTGLGWYVELECCVDADEQEATSRKILKLAEQLGLGPDVERRSYLRLLLEKNPE